MKKYKVTIFTFLTIFFFSEVHSQSSSENFSSVLQTYYKTKDKELAAKTISFLNATERPYEKLSPMLIGFYGSLFSIDSNMRESFSLNLNKITKQEFKELFEILVISNIDSIYSKTALSPAFNDMNWSSFFATGNVIYLDNIISNIPYSENRSDLNLFLTGQSAKWSLCQNSRQYEDVKSHIKKLKKNNPNLEEILKKDPQEFKDEMVSVLKDGKEKGIWK